MANIYDMSDTWNDGATTFNAIKMDVTDTASDSASLLMDLQVGGSSKFSVRKDGYITTSAPIQVGTFGIISVNNAVKIGFGTTQNSYYNLGSSSLNIGSALSIAWSSTLNASTGTKDLFIFRDAANTLAQRNSTNAQTFNLYNTYTDASNYERGFMKWSSNVLEIGAEALGTGTARDVVLSGANRVAKISDVSTGTDAAYETAINAIIDALEAHGLAATV